LHMMFMEALFIVAKKQKWPKCTGKQNVE
jgi:hypothetical protein